MLKILPICPINQETETKCGEIFCKNSRDFTIYCCFCNMKIFAFEDFLQHIQNEHLEYEEKKEFKEENSDEMVETLESCDILYDFNDDDDANGLEECPEEETVKVLNVKPKFRKRKKKSPKKDDVDKAPNQMDETTEVSPELEIGDPVYPKQKFETLCCPDCQAIFFLKKDYDAHVVKQHSGHKCPKCDMRFRHRHHLRRHLDNMHNGKKGTRIHRLKERVQCPYADCPKSFSVQESLDCHLEFHNTLCTFVCDFENCTKAFPTQQRLDKHQELHTIARTFICDFDNCGKAFPNKDRLKAHQKVHALVKRYICDTCGYSCSVSTILQVHKRMHTGERPFVCKICENAFTSQATLNLHMNTHVTIRPFVCQICQATFANRQILERHAFTHSEEKPFKCLVCEKGFKQPNGLDNHMRYVHMEPKPKKVRYFKNTTNSSETTTTT